jgi:hypothetical protein
MHIQRGSGQLRNCDHNYPTKHTPIVKFLQERLEIQRMLGIIVKLHAVQRAAIGQERCDLGEILGKLQEFVNEYCLKG